MSEDSTQIHKDAVHDLYMIHRDTDEPDTDFIGVRPSLVFDPYEFTVEVLCVDTVNDGPRYFTTLSPEDAIEFAADIMFAAEMAMDARAEHSEPA